MKEIRTNPITHPNAWRGKELKKNQEWVDYLSEDEINDINSALNTVTKKGLTWGNFGKEDFPLTAMKKRLAELDTQLLNGRGFVLLRGLPIKQYTLDQIKVIYWGLSTYMGQIMPQNVMGTMIEHIEDIKVANLQDPNLRGYVTAKRLDAHSDNSDTVVLLCVDKAERGGMSAIVSTTAIYNKMLANRPDLLPSLFEGYRYDLRGEGPTGDLNETSEPVPVFSYHKGQIRSWFHRRLILGGADKAGIQLSEIQKEALDYFVDAAHDPDLVLEHDLQPGDIQFLNNYCSVHFRTHFEDGPNHKRLLLRLWYNRWERSQLDPAFEKSWIVAGYQEREWAKTRVVTALGIRS
jgi:Taurine catabolism dioxygenase TauD, TfdA family